MKIAIYSGIIPSTTFIERLILGLAKQPGIEILLVGVKEKKINYPPNVKVVAYRSGLDYIRLFFRYLFLLTFTNPSGLKYCFLTNKKGLFNRIREFVKKAPVIYHRPDIFHIQWAKSLEEWIFLKEHPGCRIILSLRGAHINYSPIADAGLKKMYQHNFPEVDAFHAVSKAIAKEAGKYASPLNYHVVYSGLDLAQFPFASEKPAAEQLSILSIGRPHWIKGYPVALDAIASILAEKPGILIQYEIIGGTNEELTYQLNDLGLNKHVKMTPGLPFKQVIEKIKAADIVLLPSVEEGIANVVLEAMALGTLVISSNCGGMPEVIRHRETGLLFENRNANDLARVLKEAMALDRQTRQSIVQQARMIIESRHNEDKMIRDMLSLYQNTLT